MFHEILKVNTNMNMHILFIFLLYWIEGIYMCYYMCVCYLCPYIGITSNFFQGQMCNSARSLPWNTKDKACREIRKFDIRMLNKH